MVASVVFLPWTLFSLAVERLVPDPFDNEYARNLLSSYGEDSSENSSQVA